MKRILNLKTATALAVAISSVLCLTAADVLEPKVKWLESPMTVKYESILSKGETVPSIHIKDSLWESYQKVDTDIQIGLRAYIAALEAQIPKQSDYFETSQAQES